MGEKLGKLDNPVLSESVPSGTLHVISPRKVIIPAMRTPEGLLILAVLEPESEWAKRCVVLKNVGAVA